MRQELFASAEAAAAWRRGAVSRVVIRELTPDQRAAFQRATRAALERMRDGDHVVVTGVTLLASATR